VTEGFVDVTGGRVWCRSEGFGGKPPLIILHGGPGYSSDYLHNLLKLSDERQVVTYDQLGSGRSDRSENTDLWTVDRFVEELAQVRSAMGLDSRVHLYGHSWGAAIAATYAIAEAGQPVASLLLHGPYLNTAAWEEDHLRLLAAMPEENTAVFSAIDADDLDDPAYGEALNRFLHKHVCRREDWPEDLNQTYELLGTDVFSAMWGPNDLVCEGSLAGWDLTGDLHRIDIPTCLLSAEFDVATPFTCERYRQLIRNAELQVLPGLSHMSNLEDEDKVFAVLRSFMERHD
jgi:proline iminopeptidase